MKKDQPIAKLADLVNMDNPEAVKDEVLFIVNLISPQMNHTLLENAFNITFGLYRGVWPSEQACNTQFHDLRHITDTVLAMARLIHGAALDGYHLDQRQLLMGIVSALAHDAGYIQDVKDATGTGAKYTAVHVQRSVAFLDRYGQRYGLTLEEIPHCRLMVACTDLETDLRSLSFASETIALLAKLLAVSDLIGQMADRIYLEKLFYLYREFKEGKVGDFADEIDLLSRTFSFFDLTDKRLKNDLDGLDRLALPHFRTRWNIPRNLYRDAINKQKAYLQHILAHPGTDPGDFLRRKQIVQKLLKSKR